MPRPAVAIETLGCKVNQADSEAVLKQFVDLGYRVVSPAEAADVYVVNTCTVTHVADRKSRQLIRQARRRRAEAVVAVIGCFVETSSDAVHQLDGVDLVVDGRRKGDVAVLAERIRAERCAYSIPEDSEPVPASMIMCSDARDGTEGAPDLGASGRTRAFVNAQEGCADFCTYCIVPRARGRPRSVPADQVLARVRELVAEGRNEVVLAGVNLGLYGRDPDAAANGTGLAGLVSRILKETALPRLRLSSIEPHHFDEELVGLLPSDRLCRHLHLPLQSGSDSVLRRMGRRYTTAGFSALVARIRQSIPMAAITTDLIVGFPGETEAEFREGRAFLASLDLAGIHVFKYSPRSGTPASRLPDQVPEKVKKARSVEMLQMAARNREQFYRKNIGETLDVLFETVDVAADGKQVWSGLTDNYVRVAVATDRDLQNQILRTHLTEERPTFVLGSLVE